MKKIIVINTFLFGFLFVTTQAFAAGTTGGDITQVENFIQNVIKLLTGIAGLVAAGFFVVGGFGYITSSGNPENLDRSKRTIIYSAVGLAITLGAFVLSNIVGQIATNAFN